MNAFLWLIVILLGLPVVFVVIDFYVWLFDGDPIIFAKYKPTGGDR